MSTDDEFVNDVAHKVHSMLTYVQASERLRALLPHIKVIVEEVRDISKLDSELSPEMLTVVRNLEEATEAIMRCFQFATTRLDVKMED